MLPSRLHGILIASILVCVFGPDLRAQGTLIPTDARQLGLLNSYKFVLRESSTDYRFTSTTMDTTLFPRWGEESVYWVRSGPERGSFVYSDVLPSSWSSVTSEPYEGYRWRDEAHSAISFKAYSKTVAIFKSAIRQNGNSVSWEAVYFRNLFESHLYPGISYYIDEKEIDSSGLIWTTQLLVIPSFSVQGDDWHYYVDSVFTAAPGLRDRLLAFLERGGTIYTEGNAVYVIEKLGLLPDESVDFLNGFQVPTDSGGVRIDVAASKHPVSFVKQSDSDRVYATALPLVHTGSAEILARAHGSNLPVVFALSGEAARNGRVVCNTALPAVGGSNALRTSPTHDGMRQLQWILNTVMYAFSTNIDVTRSVYNEIPDSLSVGRNAASYDRSDTLEIRIQVRNLSASTIEGIEIRESIRGFFDFVDLTTEGISSTYTKPNLVIKDLVLSPHSETVIVYRIATPDPADAAHETVDRYISWSSYIYASYGTTLYTDVEGYASYRKYRNYVDLMFSARIVADTDLNWKNFLGLYYQPFKIFMMMENKERTTATDTRYVQYVPKDVPFYWTDKSIDIPILKTPGGKYVDVLRGSSNEAEPEFDMDRDGHPDAWLDTASIYPKNYTIEETSVYWLNPWEHLRSGESRLYEDIDHDGLRALDTDGDGIVDIEEAGDKIRVWKITWDVGKVSGYDFFDPYCSFELWVDPPDLVPMSAGVSDAHGQLDEAVGGMFYPYAADPSSPDLADTSWMHWMERDAAGGIIWKQLIFQSMHNYEGFTFIDTARSHYALRPTDRCAGTVPQPHREFIAVLSLGGEEIDMESPTPPASAYSNIDYTTIFGEQRNTPIRTTYTYYAPLPNPLQFEYITNNFTIHDSTGTRELRHLPSNGKARLRFDIDASTEYSYYWIRNAGHDVDFNDPSLANEGIEELGDGVFGYMLYDIPKGMGGYSVTLPKKSDGSYDVDRIVQVDGKAFTPWLQNENTADCIRILEDPFMYHIHIPQLLIPPALDDDNFDGVDDWIDDRGDRFMSKSGYLHDGFMPGNGEDYPDHPAEPFKDDIYGWVSSGWFGGADNTYGDDFFENLGKTHVTIHADFQGSGREGSLPISKGGWLVVEEIFGGSPWVLFSHALDAYAEGTNYSLTSTASPTAARFGTDTVFVRHVIEDSNEPHSFDSNFDPYHVSYGYGETTITTYAGGRDPCSFIEPAVNFSTIIDPARDARTLTLLSNADPANPDLQEYPKTVDGCFIEVRLEVSNGTDDNWINTTVAPVFDPRLGDTKVVMKYVSYPRPLVPAQVDPATGAVTHLGDDPGSFRAGWRFNQPEGEVLVKMGNTLNLMQPSRRGYFVFLISIDPELAKGVYDIGFTMTGERRKYDGTVMGDIDFEVPDCRFSISRRDAEGNVAEYQKFVIGQGALDELTTEMITPVFRGMENVRWSPTSVQYTDFDSLTQSLPAMYDEERGVESINLSAFGQFPSLDTSVIYVLEQARVTNARSAEALPITTGEKLHYTSEPFGAEQTTGKALTIATVGPALVMDKSIVAVNGKSYSRDTLPSFAPGEVKEIDVLFSLSNQGSAIAEDVSLCADAGKYFLPRLDMLPSGCEVTDGRIEVQCASLLPGETRKLLVRYEATTDACADVYDSCALVHSIASMYSGTYALSGKQCDGVFTVADPELLDFPAYDFQLVRLVTSVTESAPGEQLTLRAKVVNGASPVQELAVSFYAVVNAADTVLLEKTVLGVQDMNTETLVALETVVPASAKCIAYFAVIDPANSYGEFCEFNNVASAQLPLRGDAWILDVAGFPNPVGDRTRISYLLPREVQDLTWTMYGLDGRKLDQAAQLSVEIGVHGFTRDLGFLAAGTYLYVFEALDEHGVRRVYTGKLVKL
jgi:hypothetical protein